MTPREQAVWNLVCSWAKGQNPMPNEMALRGLMDQIYQLAEGWENIPDKSPGGLHASPSASMGREDGIGPNEFGDDIVDRIKRAAAELDQFQLYRYTPIGSLHKCDSKKGALYFAGLDSEMCYPLEHHIDTLKENGNDYLTLYEAKRMTGEDFFYCKHFDTVGEKGEGCGKLCEGYHPRNGKSGICKHQGYCYEHTDKKYLLERI